MGKHDFQGEAAPLVGKGASSVKENTHYAWWRKLLGRVSWPFWKIWNNGYLSGVAMAIFFALTVIFGKELEDEKVPPLQILAMRAVVTIPLLALLPNFTNVGPVLGSREIWHLLAMQGFFYGATVVAEWSSFALIHLADTEAIVRLAAVFGGILGWIMKGDPLGCATISGMAICLGGTVLITQPPMLFGGHHPSTWDHSQITGLLLAFAAAVLCAFQAAVVGLIDKDEGSVGCVCWINIGILSISAAVELMQKMMFMAGPGALVLEFTVSEWANFLGVVVTVLLGEVFAIRTYQQLSTGLGLAFLNLSLILITVGGWVFLGEILSSLEISGIIMVLMGILVMSREKGKTVEDDAKWSEEGRELKPTNRRHIIPGNGETGSQIPQV